MKLWIQEGSEKSQLQKYTLRKKEESLRKNLWEKAEPVIKNRSTGQEVPSRKVPPALRPPEKQAQKNRSASPELPSRKVLTVIRPLGK
jgi:hypothetical protein